jgi:hypothetical protein
MQTKPFATPILFLIFNRPDTTEKVFQQIRKIRPKQFFISADGPRQHKRGEDRLCAETQKIVEKVDWKCELQTSFSKKNLGCRIGVSSGIDWFFSHVAEGIILEDDCLPDISFFHFCKVLLKYYRNDERVMHIGGVNFQDGIVRGAGNYYFSKLNHIWGWATWKRAWDKYDVNISTYPQLLEQNLLSSICEEPSMRKYWQKKFGLVYKKEVDTWDYQWQYALYIHNGLAILPNHNLVSNIGFDVHATHTIDNFHTLANRSTACIDTVIHPPFIVPDYLADAYTFKKYLNPNKLLKLWRLLPVKSALANIIKKYI